MTDILIKGNNLDTGDMHIDRMACDNEGIDQDDASTGQGIARIASKPPKAREKCRNLPASSQREPTLPSP